MTTFTETRWVENRGIWIPNESQLNAFKLRVFCTIFPSEDFQDSLNFKYPDPKGFYGNAQLMVGGFIKEYVPLVSTFQLLYEFQNTATQIVLQIAKLVQAATTNPNFTSYQVLSDVLPINAIALQLSPHLRCSLQIVWADFGADQDKTSSGSDTTPAPQPPTDAGLPSLPYNPTSPGSREGDKGYTSPTGGKNQTACPVGGYNLPGNSAYPGGYTVLATYPPGRYAVTGFGSTNNTYKAIDLDAPGGLFIWRLDAGNGSNGVSECTVITFDLACNPTQHDAFPGVCNWKIAPTIDLIQG